METRKHNCIFYLIGIIVLVTLSSCEEEDCTSCIAQSKIDKTILEMRIECDKSDSFLSGFRDGFRSNYNGRNDVEVICNQ